MKHIKTFKSYLFEFKSVSTLYHYTSFNSLEGILEEDRMESSAVLNYISFSRNSLLNFNGKTVRITFDGSAMSEKFHLEPFMYDPSKDDMFNHDDNFEGTPEPLPYNQLRKEFGEEREERITKSEIRGVKRYIESVEIILNKKDEDFETRLNALKLNNQNIEFSIVEKFSTPSKLHYLHSKIAA